MDDPYIDNTTERSMNDQTRKALELARDWFDENNKYASISDVLAAIDAALKEPAAPVAREPSRDQCDQILKGVGAAVTIGNREYLRVWLRDWFAHGIGQGAA